MFVQDAGQTVPGVVGTYWTNTGFIGAPSFADYQTQINYSVGTLMNWRRSAACASLNALLGSM